ncbi:MAG: translation initiation factor IF-2 subunit alpha [Nanoarchaeota archaeon]
MWFKKTGLPEEQDIVSCTVKNILPHSVFVTIDEYTNLEGLIHISEISPGRIRNIRDFVKEGKKLICKVLRADKVKNQIDLSLRRVSLGQRKTKIAEAQLEEKAEKLLDSVGKKLNLSIEEMYQKLGLKLVHEFGSLSNALQLLVEGKTNWETIKNESIKKELMLAAKEKIKLPEVSISGTFLLSSNEGDGIDVIKNILKNASDLAVNKKYKLNLTYLGAPKYKVTIHAGDYKSAEKQLSEISELVIKDMKKHGTVAELVR